MSTDNTKTLPLLSLRNLVLFPGAVMPVEIGRASSLRLIEALGGKGARVLVGTQKDADIEEPAGADLYTICVEGEVVRIVKAAENRVTAVLRGMERRRVIGFAQEKPYLVASYENLVELRKDPIEIDGLGMAVYDVAKQLIAISPDIPDETAQVLDQNKDPGRLGDIVAATVDLSPEERASLLVESDVAERLRRLLVLLQRKVELIKVKQKIDSQVREEFSKHQREAVLRQKLKAIQDELGEGEDASDLDAFDEKIKASEMPADVEKTARKQLDRLKQMAQSSAEYTVQRTYLEWLVELPWSKRTEDRLDLDQAREILDTHPRVPRSAQAGARQEGTDPLSRGASRRRQDVAGQIDRALAGTRIHPCLAGWRARRGGSSRPPAHVHRRPPRPRHPGHAPCRNAQPGVHARRDRQAGR
jgi:ATP-dependent Lon protease